MALIVFEGSPFPKEEFAKRRANICQRMKAEGVDALLIFDLENICYLTGYETNGNVGLTAVFLSQDGKIRFFTRGLDVGNLLPLLEAAAISDYAVYQDEQDSIAVLAVLIREAGHGKSSIGLDKTSLCLPIDVYERLLAALPDVSFGGSNGIIERLRHIKSPAEIDYHRAAAELSVAGMKAGMAACRPVGSGR